jgi:hypothetical protein
MLYSLHLYAANAVNAPEFALEKKEAENLAKAVADVTDHYGVGAFGVWGNLGMVAAGIYGPRLAAAMFRKRLAAQ